MFFLDLGIRTKNNRFSIRLYDKPDDLPFSVDRIPYLRSNILSKRFYSAFGEKI